MAHIHNIYDTDDHFKVDGTTRAITNVSSTKITVIQYDHNSERFTFEIPRYIDGHDMSECNVAQVHYINTDAAAVNKSSGVYEIDDLQVSPDDDSVVICSWLISSAATRYAGLLNFLIQLKCVTNGTVDYRWSTGIYKGISVSDGMNNGDAIAAEYVDVLAQFEERIAELESSLDSTATLVTVGEVELLAENWVGEESPYSQEVTIDGITANSMVDLEPSVEQLAIFHNKDLAFVAENEDGVVTVYAIGDKPANDYTIQVSITEVNT